MRFQFTYKKEEPIKLQTLLRQHHFSSAQIKKLKYHGGYVFVNHKRRPFG